MWGRSPRGTPHGFIKKEKEIKKKQHKREDNEINQTYNYMLCLNDPDWIGIFLQQNI